MKKPFRWRRTNRRLSRIDGLRVIATVDREFNLKYGVRRACTVVVGQSYRTGRNYTGVFV